MNKRLMLSFAILLSAASFNTIAKQTDNDACNITVYEKTPGCYVTNDGDGCITISNSKPKCSKNSCTIAIPGCTTKHQY